LLRVEREVERARRVVASVVAAVVVVSRVTAVVAWAVRSMVPWLESLVRREVVRVVLRVGVVESVF
jgi:hypothetical protein